MAARTRAEWKDAKALGRLIRDFRKKNSHTQASVAAELFRDPERASDISKYENGHILGIKPSTVKRFVEYLGIPRARVPLPYQWQEAGQGAFEGFDFGISVSLVAEAVGARPPNYEVLKLSELRIELREAASVEPDPADEDYEVDIRLGFDQFRLSLLSEGISLSSNYMLATMPMTPDEVRENEYVGSFVIRKEGSCPPNWTLHAKKEGDILTGGVKAPDVCEVFVVDQSVLVVELTARREALKVRIVDEAASRAPKSMIDAHRDKMCEAVLSRKFRGRFEEYLLYSEEIPCYRPGVDCNED